MGMCLQRALRILQNYRCKFEERDVMLSRQFQTELRERCPKSNTVPQVFLNGAYLGVCRPSSYGPPDLPPTLSPVDWAACRRPGR
jgi:glutaredoxin